MNSQTVLKTKQSNNYFLAKLDEGGEWFWILLLIIKRKYKLQEKISDLTDLQILFLMTVQEVYGTIIERHRL